ncbi:hypothetical protein FUT87_20930 [Mitsuaria sp. TWR114]|uniref:TadE/TadG family type IV pilus assembly protein n=1 Tax=Mitsuaria sp. TWR114 TaxID=2601731 RepID=UPI0011BDE6B4|nr:TadE/TadG family type IV pilus assembly protein [Mitsuaria sp. TWR114]TXD79146.1 hypothetical protein FUT87_20930 [Mitsuaria sp. TWR114]
MSAARPARLLPSTAVPARRAVCSARGACGVAAVELALLMSPLLLLVFGASELGRAVFSYNMLDKSVRDAARHLSQHGPGDATIATEARCLAVYGTTDCSGSVKPPPKSIEVAANTEPVTSDACVRVKLPRTTSEKLPLVGVTNTGSSVDAAAAPPIRAAASATARDLNFMLLPSRKTS